MEKHVTVLGILYISTPSYLILWDIFGIILLITIFGNLILILINSNKKNGICRYSDKLNIFSYCYLALIRQGEMVNFFP